MRVNARALLLNNSKTGVDPLVDSLLSTEDTPEKALLVQARSIYVSKLKKQYVEAALLCCPDLSKISALLEIPEDVLKMYSDVFYDVLDFDKLSKMELLDTKDKEESLLKVWALSQGLEFLAWRLGKQVTISPTDGLVDLFTTCVYKSKEAMFCGNTAEASKEAVRWTKMSLDIARLLKAWVTDTDAAKNELELALRTVSPDFDGFESLDAEWQVE